MIELLVVIVIIGLLAGLLVPAIQRARQAAVQTKSLSTMKNVLQAGIQYSAENNGEINTLRWAGENLILGPGGAWVGNTFWGRLQPYLYPEISTTNQSQLLAQMRIKLKDLFGTDDMSKMTGTPFAGAPVYGDTSGLPVPFAFNKYLHPWNGWVRQQQVYSLPRTIFATYGWAEFDEVDGETYQPMVKDKASITNNIYYMPSKKAIVGFLDGRVEFMSPPILERAIKIDGTE